MQKTKLIENNPIKINYKKIYFFTKKQIKVSKSYEKKNFYINTLQKIRKYSRSKIMRK